MAADQAIAEAAWATIKAAWLCDTRRYWQGSHNYRLRAVELLDYARERQQCVISARGGDCQLKADLLRQCGDFDRAQAAVFEGFAADPDSPIKEMLLFEQRLIEAMDRGRHSFSEIEGRGNHPHKKRARTNSKRMS